jgi:integrase
MSGKIQKRGKGWSVMVDLPPEPGTGKRRQTRITAPTKKEVDTQRAQLLASMATGGFAEADAKKMTVEQYLERWLQAHAPTVRPTTHDRYTDLVKKHINPKIGHIFLAKLSALDLQGLYSDRLTKGKLSPTTVQHIHNILHKALKQAVRSGLLARNVTEAVDAPRRITPQYKVWSTVQSTAFLRVADSHEWTALWRLALMTGMRRGEILGLTWEALDLARGVLQVNHTMIRGVDGKMGFGQPKTAAGRRTISLPYSVVEALKKHRVTQIEEKLRLGTDYQDQSLVFANADGTPIHPNTLTYQFRKLIGKANVPRIRIHDLRHTSATLLLSSGENAKVVQERLGHADVSMTLNIYAHVTPDMQRGAADKLEALMSDVS